MNGAVCASQNCCFNVLSDSHILMASGRIRIPFFLYVRGRGELLHCKMEAEVEEQKG